VAISLNNLGTLHRKQRKLAEAEGFYRRALTIYEEYFGPDHPETATSLNNLAELYFHRGEYQRAEPLLRRALAIKEKSLGPDHPSVAITLRSYALLLRKLKQKEEAGSLEARARKILANCGPNCQNPHTVDIQALHLDR
jgi:tetratricopeptide (TPR) repeat protein